MGGTDAADGVANWSQSAPKWFSIHLHPVRGLFEVKFWPRSSEQVVQLDASAAAEYFPNYSRHHSRQTQPIRKEDASAPACQCEIPESSHGGNVNLASMGSRSDGCVWQGESEA